jgi:hypothetical protein
LHVGQVAQRVEAEVGEERLGGDVGVAVDGRLLMVNLTPDSISDSAYDRGKLLDRAACLDFVIEVVRKIEGQQGFQVLPRRSLVERTFGWMTRWRRLVRDYEARIDVSEAMIHVAMGASSCAASRTSRHPKRCRSL